MQTKIDWFSFTLAAEEEPINAVVLHEMIVFKLQTLRGGQYEYIFNGLRFAAKHGRPPYKYCLEREDRGIRIFGGSNTKTILVEITGRACDGFNQLSNFQSFASPLANRVTRIDVASDINTGTQPGEFASMRSSRRFQSVGTQRSATGETVYIGSAKSDRFARVYRYSDPHPRSALLRVEHVFRRDLARSALQAILLSSSYSEIANIAGEAYGWQHPDWKPGVQTDLKISARTISRDEAGTIQWLYTQVAPAVRKLIASGTLDFYDWCEHITGADVAQ